MIIPKYDESYAISLNSATTANNAPVVTKLKNTNSLQQKWELVPIMDIIASTFTFATYNMGHDASGESELFYDYMKDLDFMAVDRRDTSRIYSSPYRMKSMSRYADIVYMNGHGGRRCNLYAENYTGDPDDFDTQGYLIADTTISTGDSIPKTGIGARWKDSSHTATMSSWDLYTKWVIFGGCRQMNYDNPNHNDGAFWNGLRAAQIWVLTMKSDGRKVHGIMGYYDEAPGTTAHKDDIKLFFDYLDDHTIAGAWENACDGGFLGKGSRNWAVLYYGPCQSDKITQGRIVYTEPSQSDYIYYKKGGWGSRIDNTLNYSTSSALQSTSFLTAQNDAVPNAFPAIQITNKPLTESEVNLDVLPEHYSIELKNDSLVIERDCTAVPAEDFSLGSQQEIYQQALHDLNELGVMPESGTFSAYPSEVQQVIFDSECNPLSDTLETVESSIVFYQTYKGRELFSDTGNGIRVTYDKNGLKSLQYQWKEITEKAGTAALSSASANTDARFVGGLEESEQASAYYVSEAYKVIDNTIHRVKVYSTDPGFVNAIFVDAETGEILS